MSFSEKSNVTDSLTHPDKFVRRHIGPSADETREMLALLGLESLDALIDAAVPAQIRLERPLALPGALSESEALAGIKKIAGENKVFRSFLGMGYHDCHIPPVIQRCVLENPGWYTQYTPYQAEISQGRLEALLNFQTLASELTALDIANASMLDEATAAAEAMTMSHRLKEGRNRFFISSTCHPQTIDVVRSRAEALKIEVILGVWEDFQFDEQVFGDPAALKRLEKIGMDASVTTMLNQLVVSISGETDRKKISDAVKSMSAGDSRALRNYINKIQPEVKMVQTFVCSKCDAEAEVDVPLGAEFFWPS